MVDEGYVDEATAGAAGPDATATVEAVRAALAEDLDAPRALAAVDAWVDRARAVSGEGVRSDEGERPASAADVVPGAPALVATAVDALLGVRL